MEGASGKIIFYDVDSLFKQSFTRVVFLVILNKFSIDAWENRKAIKRAPLDISWYFHKKYKQKYGGKCIKKKHKKTTQKTHSNSTDMDIGHGHR